MSEEREAIVEAAASRAIGGAVSLTDVKRNYPWARRHDVYMARAREGERVVAIGDEGEPLLCADSRDLAPLNLLFLREEVRLPEGIPVEQLAKAIRAFLAGPGGFVAGRDFLEKHRRLGLEDWLRPGQAPELIERQCSDPVPKRVGSGWVLDFQFFTKRGGVERWTAKGDERSLQSATYAVTYGDGYFRFPYG